MSIQKLRRRNGTTVYLARVYVDSRQRSRSFPTRKQAKQWEGETLSARERGTWISPESGSALLEEHARAWLAQLRVRPSTRAAYTSYLEGRILPALGDLPLNRIRRPHVQRFVAGLDLAPQTIRTCYTVLAMVMKDAVTSELIPVSPCRDISLPPRNRPTVRPLSPAEIEAVTSEMPARYQVACWISVGAGLRVSEVLGLTVGRVDFLRRQIRVEEQLQGGELAPLKSRSSRRVIPVDNMVLEKIAEHLRRWPSDGLLITSKVGKPVRLSVFETCWRKAVSRAGLEGIVFHDLRKTYGSILVRGGLNVLVVRDRLGHSDASLTLSTYAGLWPDDAEVGRGVVEAAFARHARSSALG
jgi:integrase